MAGEFYLFHAALEKMGDGTIDLDTHAFKFALVTGSVTPANSTANPCWGAGGTTNLSSYEVTPGGNYTAGGPSLTTVTWTESAGIVTFDCDNVTIAQHASNPTNARWAVVYDDTAANNDCVGYIDIGGTTDLSAGAFTYNVSTSGLFYTRIGT